MNRRITYASMVIVASLLGSPDAQAASVEPNYVDDNPTCQELGYDFEFKIDPPNAGTYANSDGLTVTVTTDGTYFNWTSNLGIDAVIAKGGDNANLYVYDPPPPEAFSDTGLHSPINPNTGNPYGLSHISFCYDLNVEVTKTANTSYDRKWSWMIDKTADHTDVTLLPGQTLLVNYTVSVDTTGSVDSNWAVSGQISTYNPASIAANITSVTDMITPDNKAGDVVCPVSFPYSLASHQTLMCTYSADLPDGTDRLNTAEVTTTGTVDGGTGTADVNFSNATVTEIDECVKVTDSLQGFLGIVCKDDASKTFTYSRWIGPFEGCEPQTVKNEALFETIDTASTGKDNHVINVTVACEEGCTLTQGFWKTHSECGPAPEDERWAQIDPGDSQCLLAMPPPPPAGNGCGGADTPFFCSGKTWYQVFWTAPNGNPYYILADQYMAAVLNILAGADSTSAVDAALAGAKAYFEMHLPSYKPTKAEKAQLLAWATTLEQYNTGLIGPGHCTE